MRKRSPKYAALFEKGRRISHEALPVGRAVVVVGIVGCHFPVFRRLVQRHAMLIWDHAVMGAVKNQYGLLIGPDDREIVKGVADQKGRGPMLGRERPHAGECGL